MPRPDKPDFGVQSAEVLACLALTPLAWILYLGGQIAASGTVSVLHLGMAGMCCLALFGLRAWGPLALPGLQCLDGGRPDLPSPHALPKRGPGHGAGYGLCPGLLGLVLATCGPGLPQGAGKGLARISHQGRAGRSLTRAEAKSDGEPVSLSYS